MIWEFNFISCSSPFPSGYEMDIEGKGKAQIFQKCIGKYLKTAVHFDISQHSYRQHLKPAKSGFKNPPFGSGSGRYELSLIIDALTVVNSICDLLKDPEISKIWLYQWPQLLTGQTKDLFRQAGWIAKEAQYTGLKQHDRFMLEPKIIPYLEVIPLPSSRFSDLSTLLRSLNTRKRSTKFGSLNGIQPVGRSLLKGGRTLVLGHGPEPYLSTWYELNSTENLSVWTPHQKKPFFASKFTIENAVPLHWCSFLDEKWDWLVLDLADQFWHKLGSEVFSDYFRWLPELCTHSSHRPNGLIFSFSRKGSKWEFDDSERAFGRILESISMEYGGSTPLNLRKHAAFRNGLPRNRHFFSVPFDGRKSKLTFAFEKVSKNRFDKLGAVTKTTQVTVADPMRSRRVHLLPTQCSIAAENFERRLKTLRWLIYLPPTMSGVPISTHTKWPENPVDALSYFGKVGVKTGSVQFKHMGARAVVLICKNSAVARSQFPDPFGAAIDHEACGAVLSRTGTALIEDSDLEQTFLEKIHLLLEETGFWNKQGIEWVCFDGELLPWSHFSPGLVSRNLEMANIKTHEVNESISILSSYPNSQKIIQNTLGQRLRSIDKMRQTTVNYCWDVGGIENIRYAPFSVIANSNEHHIKCDQAHQAHQLLIGEIIAQQKRKTADRAPLLNQTDSRSVDFSDPSSWDSVIRWWEYTIEKGGEGLVVKPANLFSTGTNGTMVQPALKVRGKEHLRLIYGPEFDESDNIHFLKPASKHRIRRKRKLAIKQFLLGKQALDCYFQKQEVDRLSAIFVLMGLQASRKLLEKYEE